LHVLGSKIFLGESSDILDSGYKIERTFHHVWKFRAHRPTEISQRKERIASKI